jgi:hypothetical protein
MSSTGVCHCCGQSLPYKPQREKNIVRARKIYADDKTFTVVEGDFDNNGGPLWDWPTEEWHANLIYSYGHGLWVATKKNPQWIPLAPLFF